MTGYQPTAPSTHPFERFLLQRHPEQVPGFRLFKRSWPDALWTDMSPEQRQKWIDDAARLAKGGENR